MSVMTFAVGYRSELMQVMLNYRLVQVDLNDGFMYLFK